MGYWFTSGLFLPRGQSFALGFLWVGKALRFNKKIAATEVAAIFYN